MGGRSPKPLPTPLSTFSLLSNIARPLLLGRRSPVRVGLAPPPLQRRPRAWGAEVDRREHGVPAGVPILTFDKGRLGRPGWLTQTVWLTLHQCHVKRLTCTTPQPGQEGSVLLPILLMKKMSFRELKERVQGHTPVRVEEPGECCRALNGEFLELRRVELWRGREGPSRPREQQEQRWDCLKG